MRDIFKENLKYHCIKLHSVDQLHMPCVLLDHNRSSLLHFIIISLSAVCFRPSLTLWFGFWFPVMTGKGSVLCPMFLNSTLPYSQSLRRTRSTSKPGTRCWSGLMRLSWQNLKAIRRFCPGMQPPQSPSSRVSVLKFDN